MLINIWIQTGKTIVLIVKQSDTILSVKNKIHAAEGIPPDSYQLIYNGEVLDNGCTLSHYGVKEESRIFCGGEGKYRVV
jgi:ubiquitin